MIKIKFGIFDRVELTFMLIRKHIFSLMIPLLMYKGFGVGVVLLGFLFFGLYSGEFKDLEPEQIVDMFFSIGSITTIIGVIILFVIYLMLGLVVYVGLFTAIKNICHGGESTRIDDKNYIFYGKKNFGKALKTYWYIFQYIYLWPCIIMIVGGFISIISNRYDNEMGIFVGIGGMIFGLMYFLYSSIFRGIKAVFGIYNAIDEESFSKESFYQSIKYTKNNWWRVLGNLGFAGLVLIFLIGFIEGIFSNIFFTMSGAQSATMNGIQQLFNGDASFNELITIIEASMQSNSYFVINQILGVVGDSFYMVFYSMFAYVFYLRLKREYEYNSLQPTKKEEL